jgi:hypothetical protein
MTNMCKALAVICSVLSAVAHVEAQQTRVLLAIGGDDAPPTSAFQVVSDLAVRDDGSIVVLDARSQAVSTFDASGRVLWRYEKRGAGPGEFRLPTKLQLDTTISVFDPPQRRFVVLSMEGGYRGTQLLPIIEGIVPAETYLVRHGYTLTVAAPQFSYGSAAHNPNEAVYLVRPGGKPMLIHAYRSDGAMYYPARGAAPWGVARSHLPALGAWALANDSILYAVDGVSGTVKELRVREAGLSTTNEWSLGRRAQPVTDSDRQVEITRLRQAGRELPARPQVDVPSHRSVGSAAVVSSEGTVWVRVQASSAGDTWASYHSNGAPAGTIQLPQRFLLKVVRGGRLYGVWTTPLGTPVVWVLQVSST